MKVYKVYENLDAIGIPKSSHDDYGHEIVAFTNDKKILDEYMQVRKKKRFIVDKVHMNRDEYASFANRNRLQMIEYHDLTMIDKKDGTWSEVRVPMTSYQYSTLTEDQESFGCRGGSIPFYGFFKQKYTRALEILQYTRVWMSINDPSSLGEFGMPEFIFDQVKMYAKLFDEEFK